jgi:hypothetical protein
VTVLGREHLQVVGAWLGSLLPKDTLYKFDMGSFMLHNLHKALPNSGGISGCLKCVLVKLLQAKRVKGVF